VPLGSGEARGVGQDGNYALNRPSKLTSVAISSLPPGNLISIPDSSPRAYGGVGYSFIGFFR
jgi:hypothetical protein